MDYALAVAETLLSPEKNAAARSRALGSEETSLLDLTEYHHQCGCELRLEIAFIMGEHRRRSLASKLTFVARAWFKKR